MTAAAVVYQSLHQQQNLHLVLKTQEQVKHFTKPHAALDALAALEERAA